MLFNVKRQPQPLWPYNPPLCHGNEPEFDLPTITPYFPIFWKKNRKAVVILPGGGYTALAQHEGKGYAEFLADHGYTCFVVNYRLGSHGYHHPAELSDAARAVRLVRSEAENLGIRQDCIGIMGSSAGGHLAASLGNLYKMALTTQDEGDVANISSRPDWMLLCYPVISADEKIWHRGSFVNLLGTEEMKKEDLELLSLEKSVSKDTPPAFIWHTMEDNGVPCDNSMRFAQSLRANQVPFELHIYEKGWHGIGLCEGHPWAEEALRWMNQF